VLIIFIPNRKGKADVSVGVAWSSIIFRANKGVLITILGPPGIKLASV